MSYIEPGMGISLLKISCNLIYMYFFLCSTVSIGRNQPLNPDKPKWKSDVPLTEGQLRSKRDEFWDTAPAFEGRKEIWDALKEAAYQLEAGDYALAQAIVDGANISLPNGMWTESNQIYKKYI